MVHFKIRSLFIAMLISSPLASAVADDLPVVEKPMQRNVEITCRLDIFTPMLYEGITSNVGGKTSLTFNRTCAELRGQEYKLNKTDRAILHPKSLMLWDSGLMSVNFKVNDQIVTLDKSDVRKTLRVISLGRMTLVDFGTVGRLYDNTEQHWCPFALKFPEAKLQSPPLYWYEKKSQNIVRFYQGVWAGPIQKTQHHLPAACSNSRTPAPAPKAVIFKMGKDIPVREHTGPVIVSY